MTNTHDTLKKNIIDCYRHATKYEVDKGRRWYRNAHLICEALAIKYGFTVYQVAGVIAATSPQTNWFRNQEITEAVLSGQRVGLHTATVMQKCDAILATENDEAQLYAIADIVYGSKGWKTSAFFFNLTGSTDNVTIDRHAMSIALGTDIEWKWMTKNRYAALERAYSEVARELDEFAPSLQAITWLAWRRMKGLNDHEDYTV